MRTPYFYNKVNVFQVFHISTNIEQVKKMSNRFISINKIQCKKCRDIIESRTVNDFKTCTCGSVSISGGKEYLRRLGNVDDYIEMCEWEKEKG